MKPKNSSSENNFHPSFYIALILGWFIIIYLLFLNPMKDKIEYVYSSEKLNSEILKKISFQDITSKSQVEYSHRKNSSKGPEFLGSLSPSVLLYDFDSNGYLDIFYSGGNRNFLYLNQGNEVFKEAASEYGLLGEKNKESISSMAIMADVNNDGLDDLYLSSVGVHRLFIKQKNKKMFKEETFRLGDYRSFPDGVNFIDFNMDGRLDIVVGNLIELKDKMLNMPWYMPRRYDQKGGGVNHVLVQDSSGFFKLHKSISFQNPSFTHSVGISRIDKDFYPDIFFANDYAKDEMYLNDQGQKLIDVTDKYIPKVWHGNSGMNAEFADFNQDGENDLYVTYIHKPPFYRTYNILWSKLASGDGFEQASWDRNVGKCGFSWGAKASDFNLDGKLDLIVVNGKEKNSKLKKASDGKSFWYYRTQLTSLPSALLGYMQSFDRGNDQKFYSSAFERDCLFIQSDNNFFDVAEDLGLTDAQEGRGLAVGDLDNDGLMDIVVTNLLGTSKVYKNTSNVKEIGNWIGFELVNSKGSVIPIGAEIKLVFADGSFQFKEYYPANGYRGQSDYRIHFGFPKEAKIKELQVRWPMAKSYKSYKLLSLNSYNTINE